MNAWAAEGCKLDRSAEDLATRAGAASDWGPAAFRSARAYEARWRAQLLLRALTRLGLGLMAPANTNPNPNPNPNPNHNHNHNPNQVRAC